MKTFTDKKERKEGEIAQLLKNVDASQRSKEKAKAFEKIKNISFEREGFTVTILKKPVERRGTLIVEVMAMKNGNLVNVSNPLIFVNPPIMVPDGTYHKEYIASIDKEIDVANFKEDAEQALELIIVDVLKASV
jgi:hypothetical protein